MHKRQNKFGIRCLVAMLSGAMVLTSYAAPRVIASSYQNQIDDAKDKKQELEQKQKELKQKIQNLESKKGDILDYIEELDKELETLTDQITELNKEIKSVNEKLEETKINLEKATEKEKSQYETMKKRIQYMYENGETSIVEVLLSSENIADLLNQVEYVSEITSYDNSLLERYEETKKQVEEMKVSLEKSLEEKNLLSDELNMSQDALEEMMENKQTELKKYEANINESESLVSEVNAQIAEQENMIEDLLEKERKRIEEEERRRKEEEERKRREEEERRKREEEEKRQQQLQQQQQQNNQSSNNSSSNNSSSNTTVSSGGFLWPVPSSGRITCGFGYRESPTAGASTYHQGIDIGAPTGANIVATKAGTVVTASYNRGAGNYVMIHHGDGVYSVYMHCSKLLVSVGQSVSRGEVIALVGSTGFSTGPHLHFALSVGGTYVNPRKYVNP